MKNKIRLANESDAKQIAHVHIQSLKAIYRCHISDKILDELSLDKRTQEWKTLLQKGVEIFVVEKQGVIVGFASICPSRDEDVDSAIVAEISAIYLLPEFWRQGLGRVLCHVIFDHVKYKGYSEISLWVLESNQTSRHFYEAMGFGLTGDSKLDDFGGEALLEVRYCSR